MNPDNILKPDGSQYRAKNAFTYVTPDLASTLTNGTSTTFSFNIDGDADFFWTKFTAFGNTANDGTTYSAQELPGVTALITNNTTGRNYSNNPVALPSYAGTANLPFILPMITYWQAKATITITVANITDNKDYTRLQLQFHGIKAYL